mmetsp:Transcript_14448/g.25603  ORF Transcript_14448/g.25603 Transcript_14448/m.25603 type:complete len:235 (+) Transcript_14448:134-838(+)
MHSPQDVQSSKKLLTFTVNSLTLTSHFFAASKASAFRLSCFVFSFLCQKTSPGDLCLKSFGAIPAWTSFSTTFTSPELTAASKIVGESNPTSNVMFDKSTPATAAASTTSGSLMWKCLPKYLPDSNLAPPLLTTTSAKSFQPQRRTGRDAPQISAKCKVACGLPQSTAASSKRSRASCSSTIDFSYPASTMSKATLTANVWALARASCRLWSQSRGHHCRYCLAASGCPIFSLV